MILDSPKIHRAFTHPPPDFLIVPPMQRAFGMQFYSVADLYSAAFMGRVVHVGSGRADGFRSAEERVKLFEQAVKDFEEAAPDEAQESPLEHQERLEAGFPRHCKY